MGISAAKFKVMPIGLDVDLDKLKEEVKAKIESFETGRVDNFEEQPIAFGLKALIVTFALDESKEVDEVENAVNEVEDVSSVELIDYRRAVG